MTFSIFNSFHLIFTMILIYISLLFIQVLSKDIKEPISHQAARLLQPGIVDIFTQSNMSFHNVYDNESTPISKVLHSPLGSFKAYRPDIFQVLRSHAGVSEISFIKAIDPMNLICISSDSKSGSAFWKTSDNNFVLKTIKHYECKNLITILDDLRYHMLSDLSCIGSILGVYRVKLKRGGKRYFMIAKNIYSSNNVMNSSRNRKYDLKGSTIGRKAKSNSEVRKDLDLIESKEFLELGAGRDIILKCLSRDADFMMRHGFMDYSLLVSVEEQSIHSIRRFFHSGLHSNPISTLPSDRGKLVCLGSNQLVYHFGIIDFLQKYTFRKYLETFFKAFIYDVRKISCRHPKFYAKRFFDFIATYSK